MLRFRRDAIGLLRRRWAWLTLATVVSHVSLFLVLLSRFDTLVFRVTKSGGRQCWLRLRSSG